MGLDMNICKIKKISDDEIQSGRYNYTKPYSYPGFIYIPKNDYDDDSEMYHDIFPLLQKVSLAVERLDYDLIKIDNEIPKEQNFYSLSYGPDGTTLRFKTKEVYVSESERPKYTKYSFEEYYIAEYKELSYWRKDYDLQDELYAMYSAFSERIRLVLSDYHTFGPSRIRETLERIGKDRIRQKDITEISKLLSRFRQEYLETMPSSICNCGFHFMTKDMLKAVGHSDITLEDDEMIVYHEWY